MKTHTAKLLPSLLILLHTTAVTVLSHPINSAAKYDEELSGPEMQKEYIWTLENIPLAESDWTESQAKAIRSITSRQWTWIAEAYNRCAAVASKASLDRQACPVMIKVWRRFDLGPVPEWSDIVWEKPDMELLLDF
ncbi:hypothetical protein TWF694_002630 [Orbilia ellipsospora]|uniref:Uncharacterized protein n=1 Tax=Orbilia ellipsospora TaxID=2528407 RepID=A0AAV9X549_9PEZI